MLTLASWLEADPVRLSRALELRPDVGASARGRDTAEIARRLEHPDSLIRLAQWLTLPHFQVLEAALALGHGATLATVAGLLADSGAEHEAHVLAVADELIDRAFMWPDPSGRLLVASGAEEMWPYPLGLGQRAATLLSETGTAQLRALAKAQGVRPLPPSRGELAGVIAGRLGDPAAVRQTLASAPDGVAEEVLRLAEQCAATAGSGDPMGTHFLRGEVPEPEAHSPRLRSGEALTWAADRGLVLRSGPYGQHEMPVEVVLALGRPDDRAPFAPSAPLPIMQPADVERARSACAAAATELHQQALSILDVIPRLSLMPAASGGLPVRELARLAKHVGTSTTVARLTLELAMAGGLLELRQFLEHSATFERWRAAEPAHRYAVLVWGWWHLPFTPTQDRDSDGKAIRPLARWIGHLQGDLARHAVMTGFQEMPDRMGADRDTYLSTLLWQRPALVKLYGPQSDAWARAWDEAEMLGVLALGCVTELGQSLSDGPPVDYEPVLRRLLPEPAAVATFGSDLRATVLGPPTTALSRLLDSCAERESASTATLWRFSASSVRRALDAGTTAERLLDELAAVSDSVGELPQPLRYLVGDVQRRYGEISVIDASCVLTLRNEQQLAEVLMDRRLAALELSPIDRSSLASRLPASETLSLLRENGYFPAAPPEQQAVRASRSAGSSARGSASRRRR